MEDAWGGSRWAGFAAARLRERLARRDPLPAFLCRRYGHEPVTRARAIRCARCDRDMLLAVAVAPATCRPRAEAR
jgi:hypothetical protein